MSKTSSRATLLRTCLMITFSIVLAAISYEVISYKKLNDDLLHAVISKDSRSVGLLIRRGANPNLRYFSSANILEDIARMLVTIYNRKASQVSEKGIPLLHIAVKNYDINTVTALLKGGADINSRNGTRQTCLMLAIQNADEDTYTLSNDIISVLLHSGVDVNATEADGKDALTLAVESTQLDTELLLLKNGATPSKDNVNMRWGGDALVYAAAAGDAEVINQLLDKGANIDYQTDNGLTALMNADSAEIARLLIKRGANINIEDKKGATALKYAMYHGDQDTIWLLRNMGAKERSKK